MINIKSEILRKSKNISIIYICLMVVFISFMVLSYTIPNKRINWHVSESVKQLKSEGVYTQPFFDTHASQLDNFTDSWMLNLAMSADTKNPLKSSLENPHRVMDEYNKGTIDKVQNLEMSINSSNYEVQTYSRYWHGYLGILRPLLVFFNYTEIRFINMFALFGLFVVVNCLIKSKLGLKYAISFFTSMMMIMFIIVPMSLQFSSVFYITFISMIVLLLYNRNLIKNKSSVYFFFIVGALTSFMDLLTFPLITLGIPLVTYILLIEKESNAIINLIEIIKNSILWALGYGMTWVTKWLVASIVLRKNIVSDALNQLLTRTSDTAGEVSFSKFDIILRNKDVIFNSLIIKLFIIVLVLWLVLFFISRESIVNILNIFPIVFIAIFPYIWYMILGNHSYMHFWFTYRNQVITVFAILSLMSYCIDDKKMINIFFYR